MEITILDKEKIVEIWLANKDKDDGEAQSYVKAITEEYKRKKYTVAVFYSGAGDIINLTTSLLLHNKTNCNKQD